MWKDGISKMLSQMGWGTGFRLPIASSENLTLERELEKRARVIQLKRSELEDTLKHSEIIERGIKHSTESIPLNKKLISAKYAEITAENELLQNSERLAHNLSRECKSVEDSYKKAVLHNRGLITEVENKKDDITELAELIEFDRKELVLLEKKASDETQLMKAIDEIGDEDSETLRKYETRYRKATAEYSSMRLDLNEKVAITSMMQADLDGLSERFKKLHKERGDIVSLWKETLISLNSKDGEMKEVAEDYTTSVALLKTQTFKSDEEHKKLKEREKSAGIASLHLNKWDRKVMDIRVEITRVIEVTSSLKDNLFNYQTSIAYASKEIADLYRKALQSDKELSAMDDRITAAETVLSNLRDQEQHNSSKIFSATERIHQIEALIEEEEGIVDCLGKHLEKEIIKKNQWFNQRGALHSESLKLEHDIKSAKSNLQNLLLRSRDAGMLLERRKATIYRMELQYINAELKYAPMMNPPQDSIQFKQKEENLIEMKLDMEQTMKQKAFVTTQTDHLLNVHRRMLREKVSIEKSIAVLEQKSSDHRCLVKFSVKNMDFLVGEYQNLMIDHSLLKLKLNQMIQALRQQKSLLYDADNQRVLLQAAVKEKQAEIDAHSRLLELKQRGAKDELTQLKLQVCQVSACVGRRKKRYEIIMQLMGRQDEGEDGQAKSEAYYVLKMAQEREVYLMEVQKWKNKLAEAEKEMEGLSNVHMIMNASNTSLRGSLAPAAEDSEEVKALDKLTSEEQEMLLRRSRAKKQNIILHDKLGELEQKLAIIDHEIRATQQFSEMKEALASKLRNELGRQREKVVRWSGICGKLIKEIKPIFPQDQFELLQNDLKLRFTVSKFETAIGMFERLLFHHPYVKKYFVRRLQQDNGSMMKLYDRFSQSLSVSSSRSSTVVSSISSSSQSGSSRSPDRDRTSGGSSSDDSKSGSGRRTMASTTRSIVGKMTPVSHVSMSKQKSTDQTSRK